MAQNFQPRTASHPNYLRSYAKSRLPIVCQPSFAFSRNLHGPLFSCPVPLFLIDNLAFDSASKEVKEYVDVCLRTRPHSINATKHGKQRFCYARRCPTHRLSCRTAIISATCLAVWLSPLFLCSKLKYHLSALTRAGRT